MLIFCIDRYRSVLGRSAALCR